MKPLDKRFNDNTWLYKNPAEAKFIADDSDDVAEESKAGAAAGSGME
jgi:hypothetical protein